MIAREAGLTPLARGLLADANLDPEREAVRYVDPEKGFADSAAVLEGARAILVERMAEDADLLGRIRQHLAQRGFLKAKLVRGKEEEGKTYRDYFDHHEPLARVPSHRALAMLRGKREGVLRLELVSDRGHLEEPKEITRCEQMIARRFRIEDRGRRADSWLWDTVRTAWRQKILAHLETEALSALRERAEREAIEVFARNLGDLLMAPPAGAKVTLGLDPGLRTGVKCAIVDATGKLLATETIYPHPPRRWWRESIQKLHELCTTHRVKLIAIGNGTAGRETDKLAGELIMRHPELEMAKIMVSEAGASVYSASQTAADELPGIDVSLRGAVSIARRLQDPLAELVKIDPKSIGVGQYQHDLNQGALARGLDAVVETCVNNVGVNVNTASPDLLRRVSGLSKGLATNIVTFRDQHGRFRDRKTLLKVPRLGAKAFEQCAGFLRIREAANPLDGSAVHPEAYPVVERMARQTRTAVSAMIGNTALLQQLEPAEFTDDRFGLPTVTDILAELEKPGRDPRGEFQTADFREGVEDLEDLEPGMRLEGVVTNVTNFGAFVDVGVHQDGLVHISQLADRFVRDPREIVKAGDVVRVMVQSVDLDRRRISLTMKGLG